MEQTKWVNKSKNPIKLRSGVITLPGVEFVAKTEDIPPFFMDLFQKLEVITVVEVKETPPPRMVRSAPVAQVIPTPVTSVDEEQIAKAVQEEASVDRVVEYAIRHTGSGFYDVVEKGMYAPLNGKKLRKEAAETMCANLNEANKINTSTTE